MRCVIVAVGGGELALTSGRGSKDVGAPQLGRSGTLDVRVAHRDGPRHSLHPSEGRRLTRFMLIARSRRDRSNEPAMTSRRSPPGRVACVDAHAALPQPRELGGEPAPRLSRSSLASATRAVREQRFRHPRASTFGHPDLRWGETVRSSDRGEELVHRCVPSGHGCSSFVAHRVSDVRQSIGQKDIWPSEEAMAAGQSSRDARMGSSKFGSAHVPLAWLPLGSLTLQVLTQWTNYSEIAMSHFDAVLSIGSQSLLDAILRLVGPQLDALRTPLPIAIPGLSGGLLSIRKIEPVLVRTSGVPSGAPTRLDLRLSFEVAGHVLPTLLVPAGSLSVPLPAGTVAVPDMSGVLAWPKQVADVALDPIVGSVGGAIPAPVTLPQNAGTVTIPKADVPLALSPAKDGGLNFNGPITLPLPVAAVTPIDINLSDGLPSGDLFTVTIAFDVDVNRELDQANGFGLVFNLVCRSVSDVDPPSNFAMRLFLKLGSELINSFDALGLPLSFPQVGLTQVAAAANQISSGLRSSVSETLERAFAEIVGRTGRLVGPQNATNASCEIVSLAEHGRARLFVAPDGALALQLGFSHAAPAAPHSFPEFAPSGQLDVALNVDNAFLIQILGCVLEKLPNIAMSGGPRPEVKGVETWYSWDVVVNLGVVALKGTMALILRNENGTKSLNIAFDLTQAIRIDGIVGDAITIHVAFWVPLALDLNDLTSLVGLRTGMPQDVTTTVTLSWTAKAALAALGLVMGTPGLAICVGLVPTWIIAIAEHLLANTVDLVLTPLKALQSPAVIPAGALEAFGRLVPAELTLDDLVVRGVLRTPTNPVSASPLPI
jgi:hypothetical protein